MTRIFLAFFAVLLLWTTSAYADQHKAEDSSFVYHEYWQCDPDNVPALNKMSEEVWGPIFDELVAEGYFLGWGNLTPIGATKWGSQDDPNPEQVAPDHHWFGWWESASAEANDAAWAEVIKRLRSRHPDDPRPWLYCDTLTIVTYER